MKDLLDSLDEILPIKTNYPTNYKHDNTIKACIFDIYGTLLISSSGDIDLSDISNEYLIKAFKESGIEVQNNGCDNGFCMQVLDYFEYCIKSSHEASKKNGILYPEVDIIKIWKQVLDHFHHKGKIAYTHSFSIHQMTSTFEILSNRIFPMPGMKEIIHYLRNKNIPLGIVSNAQFYTPVIMNYFLNNKLSEAETIDLFDPDLSVFSYKEERAKPDYALFKPIINGLQQLNIKPNEALFVGNDMLKDIYTASMNGMKTVLFAGDKRSLRLRENSEQINNLKPDFVIDNLLQIKEIIQ